MGGQREEVTLMQRQIYLYQVRCSLLWMLCRQKSEPDFLVSLEEDQSGLCQGTND